MSTFDIIQDAPGLLRAESLNITINFQRTGPTTGRVSWNIPTPAAGCTAENQAYCGMLVTLGTQAATFDDVPKDGVVYSSDPTASQTLFAGDKIGSTFVVAAFYQDRDTTSFDISDLSPNTPYYISGYPVDCELRYFSAGLHAYSMNATLGGHEGESGTQVVQFNPPTGPGVKPTDPAGLVSGIKYDFTVQLGPDAYRPIGVAVDPMDCVNDAPKYKITIDGTYVHTYQDLANEINKQFALLSNPPQGPKPPNAGGYYWQAETQTLYMWDGYQNVVIPAIVQATDPTIRVVGTYWYDTTNKVLKMWDGTDWITATVLETPVDALNPKPNQFWFDGTTAWHWNGNTWCERNTIISPTPPNEYNEIEPGSFWFDTENSILYYWNSALEIWIVTMAIQSVDDPNNFPTGAFWFNESSNKLYQRDTPVPGWNEITTVTISERPPVAPAPDRYWYNPATLQLFQWDSTQWVEMDVVTFYEDPTNRASCDVWWNLTNDRLYQWDLPNSQWVEVAHFYQQSTDPVDPPGFDDGDMWYDPITKKLYVWVNQCFQEVEYIFWPTDPRTTLPDGVVWKNPNGKWYVKTGNSWIEIFPISYPTDPYNIPAGSFWFNTTDNSLNVWTGVSWMNVMYSTRPLVPTIGTVWFDSSTNTLMKWDGSKWVATNPRAKVEFDCHGNFLFTDTVVGSNSFINIIKDQGGSFGSLWPALNHAPQVLGPKPGSDEVSDQPSYLEQGIGTDGSDALRRELVNDIRYDLGYPIVDVELTQQQMDLCITKALEELRQRSGATYKRSFFTLKIFSNTQKYELTDKTIGYNRIVEVLGVYRLTSAFLSSAHGAGIYGQIVLQQLYNMGTYDLTSHFLMNNYVSMMEQLFASRVTFTWDERSRLLWMHNRFPFNERLTLLDTVVERTEQELMADRYLRPVIRKWAASFARLMLAEIRGKYSNLPSANGGVSLNATDLRQQATKDIESCIEDIENYIADRPEEYGRYDITWG